MVIAKFSNDLDTLIKYTFFGGDGNNISGDIAIDSSDNIFIVGHTTSTKTSIPGLSGGVDENEERNGGYDLVIAKFSNDLDTLHKSTFFGGPGDDTSGSIAIDSSGNVFVAATTQSTKFFTDTVLGPVVKHNGATDVVIAKFSNDLDTLIKYTFFGGEDEEYLGLTNKIAFDSSDNVYVTGATESTDIPVTSGAIQPDVSSPGPPKNVDL